jgi:hypothetical protein
MSQITDRRKRHAVGVLLIVYYVLICLLCVGEFAVPLFRGGQERITYFHLYRQSLSHLQEIEIFSFDSLLVWDAWYTLWAIFILFLFFIWMAIQHFRSHIRYWMSMIHIALSGIGFLSSLHILYHFTFQSGGIDISAVSVFLTLDYFFICVLNTAIFVLNQHHYSGD